MRHEQVDDEDIITGVWDPRELEAAWAAKGLTRDGVPVPEEPGASGRHARSTAVLCCAEEDQPRLQAVLELLALEGCHAELVTGVELDLHLVGQAARSFWPTTQWVVCQSAWLDAYQVARLRDELGEAGVRDPWWCVVNLDPFDASVLAEVIKARVDATLPVDRGPATPADEGAGRGDARAEENSVPAMPSLEELEHGDAEPPWWLASRNLGLAAAAFAVTLAGAGLWSLGARLDLDGQVAAVAVAAVPLDRTTASETESEPEPEPEPEPPTHEAALTERDDAELEDGQGDDSTGATVADPEPAPQPSPTLDAEGDPTLPRVEPDGATRALALRALRTGEVRALDTVLMYTERSRPGTFDEAKAYCDALDVEGLGGWQVADLGEIRSLTRARMVPSAMYWTRTEASSLGDAHFAWNARRQRVYPHGHRWRRGRTICVRDMPQ